MHHKEATLCLHRLRGERKDARACTLTGQSLPVKQSRQCCLDDIVMQLHFCGRPLIWFTHISCVAHARSSTSSGATHRNTAPHPSSVYRDAWCSCIAIGLISWDPKPEACGSALPLVAPPGHLMGPHSLLIYSHTRHCVLYVMCYPFAQRRTSCTLLGHWCKRRQVGGAIRRRTPARCLSSGRHACTMMTVGISCVG